MKIKREKKLSKKEENEKKNEKNHFTISFNWTPIRTDLEETSSPLIYIKKKLEDATGNIEEIKSNRFIKYPFDRYTVTIELSPNNEFIGITEIALNKDFRSYLEKIKTEKVHNIEEFNIEE